MMTTYSALAIVMLTNIPSDECYIMSEININDYISRKILFFVEANNNFFIYIKSSSIIVII